MFFYAPVRKAIDSGTEVTLASEASWSREEVQKKVDELNARVPDWHAANPVVRIAFFQAKEIPQ
jgi:hypothetical protein